MVKHCSFGTCKSDSRYPDKLRGAKFVPFAKPRSDLKKSLRWIAMCNRPHAQLNIDKVSKHTYICSKVPKLRTKEGRCRSYKGHTNVHHFISLDGPTDEYPDPCDAVTGEIKKVRRRLTYMNIDAPTTCTTEVEEKSNDKSSDETYNNDETGVSCQTEDTVFSSMEMLAYMARIRQLEEEIARLRNENTQLHHKQKHKSLVTVGCQTSRNLEFNTVNVSNSKIKNLFEFYTGLTFARFVMLLGFLFPGYENTRKNPILYGEKRKETHINRLPLSEQIFMYLCRLRNGLNLKDLAYRFDVKVQTVSTVVNSVAKYMYARLGSLSFWPHRNIIVENMTEAYKQDFSSCLAILDCTELKTEKPSSLKQQSQCYSDYKSSNTLKALVVCDPRGSILFVSDLFAGSISDNDIIEKSGFLKYLLNLKERGFIQRNDSVMADKGFRIEKELSALELGLNIPPFASSGKPFSAGEVSLTKKIASHRIHVERAINQIKCFKLLKRIIPISIFSSINAHWFNASMLTNFQDTLVKL